MTFLSSPSMSRLVRVGAPTAIAALGLTIAAAQGPPGPAATTGPQTAAAGTAQYDTPPYDTPPCVRESGDLPIHEFTSHRELRVELQRIQRVSDGVVDVERVGSSNRGRAIWTATAGEGDQVVLVTSEIHGDEKTGTDALLRILDHMGTSDSVQAQRLRREITLVAVPKFNADGAELDRRGNDRTWAEVVEQFPRLAGVEPAWNYVTDEQSGDDYSRRPGFDLNRDFHADLDYRPRRRDFPGTSEDFGWFINPESQLLRDLYVDLTEEHGGVDVYVDLHHQGPCVAQEGSLELLDVAVDYPPLPDAEFEPGGKYEQYADGYPRDYSLQLATSAFNGIEREGFIGARYPHDAERDVPGQGRSAFALNGTGTVLFEVRGQTETLGQQGRERFVAAVEAGLSGILDDVATGAVDRIDPDSFFGLPGTVDLQGNGGDDAEAAAAGLPRNAPRREVLDNLG